MGYDRINRIDELIEKGIGFTEDDRHTLKYIEWHNSCFDAIKDIYEKSSDDYRRLRESSTIENMLLNLKIISTKEKARFIREGKNYWNYDELDDGVMDSEIGIRILSKIDLMNDSSEKKKELKDLFKDVSKELRSRNVDWEKIKSLLKQSFDYGMDVAPDIVRFADAYYESRVKSD